MESNLKDKAVIITGGTSGIGKAIANRFALRGARVALFGSNEEQAEQRLRW